MLQKGDICYGYTRPYGWMMGIYIEHIGYKNNTFGLYSIYFISTGSFVKVYNVCHPDHLKEKPYWRY